LTIRCLGRNAYSKKLDNFKAAIGLYLGYYNLVKMHNEVRFVGILGVSPVDSPRKAVQVSIVAESKGE
jgi:hypothetical protein